MWPLKPEALTRQPTLESTRQQAPARRLPTHISQSFPSEVVRLFLLHLSAHLCVCSWAWPSGPPKATFHTLFPEARDTNSSPSQHPCVDMFQGCITNTTA